MGLFQGGVSYFLSTFILMFAMPRIKPRPLCLVFIFGLWTFLTIILVSSTLGFNTGASEYPSLPEISRRHLVAGTNEKRLYISEATAEAEATIHNRQQDDGKKKKIGNKRNVPLRLKPDQHKQHIRSVCSSMGLTTSVNQLKDNVEGNIIVDDKHKLLACLIPKVACTNLGKIFAVLTGIFKDKNPRLILGDDLHVSYKHKQTYLNHLSTQDIEYRINNYFSFVFVREPFERLLSAYRNKFLPPPSRYFRRISDEIVKAYRTNKTLTGNATFAEYVTYLTDPNTKVTRNIHWEPYFKLCRPCEIEYSFIANLSTFGQDLQYIIDKHNLSSDVDVPSGWLKERAHSLHRTGTYLEEYYSTIPRHMLRKLYRVFYPDFVIFNIPVPAVIQKMMSRHRS